MTLTKVSNANSNSEFKHYRDIAPEAVDDDMLKSLIIKKCGNHEQIVAAIENMWHDLPEKDAIGADWKPAAKNKKTTANNEVPAAADKAGRGRQSGASRGGKRSADRGSRAPSAPSAGGRGVGAGGRGASRPRPAGEAAPAASLSPPTVAANNASVDQENIWNQAASNGVSVTAMAAAPGVSLWGQGGSLAEKLKRQKEAELNPPKPLVLKVEQKPTNHTAAEVGEENGGRRRRSRGRGGRKSEDESQFSHALGSSTAPDDVEGREITQAISSVSIAASQPEPASSLSVMEVMLPRSSNGHIAPGPASAPSVSSVSSSAPLRALSNNGISESRRSSSAAQNVKLGKFQPSAESAFQFGSFGNFGAEDLVPSASLSSVPGPSSSTASAWRDATESSYSTIEASTQSAVVWGTTSGGSSTGNTSLVSDLGMGVGPASFPSQSTTAKTTPAAPTSAPPGLDPASSASKGGVQGSATRNGPNQAQPQTQLPPRNKHDTNQQPQNQQYPQYQQPPGIPLGNGRGGVPAGPGLPPYYPGGFDPNQPPQYMHPSAYAPVPGIGAGPPPGVGAASIGPAATGQAPAGSASATPAAAQQQHQQLQQPQQQQQQQFAPPPGMANPYAGFYPNPYFPNQAFYYGQPQNYYGQGRNVYQPPRGPYSADPYGAAAAGSLYPDLYPGNQFLGEPAGSYGGMPMHPSMQQQSGQQPQQQPGGGSTGSAAAAGGLAGPGKQGKVSANGGGAAAGPSANGVGTPQDPASMYNAYNPYAQQGIPGQWGGMQQFPASSPVSQGGLGGPPGGFSNAGASQQGGGQGQVAVASRAYGQGGYGQAFRGGASGGAAW